jgi:hypothetical protein
VEAPGERTSRTRRPDLVAEEAAPLRRPADPRTADPAGRRREPRPLRIPLPAARRRGGAPRRQAARPAGAARQLRAREDHRGLRLRLQPGGAEGQDPRPRHLQLGRGPTRTCSSSAPPASASPTHLAQAFGDRACRAGCVVLYVGAHDLFAQVRAARGDGTYDRRLLRITTPDLVIVDDLGLRPLSQDEPMDLYEVVRQGSLVITSNRALEEWHPLFGNPLLASARDGPAPPPRPRHRHRREFVLQPAGEPERPARGDGAGGRLMGRWRSVWQTPPACPSGPIGSSPTRPITRSVWPTPGRSPRTTLDKRRR